MTRTCLLMYTDRNLMLSRLLHMILADVSWPVSARNEDVHRWVYSYAAWNNRWTLNFRLAGSFRSCTELQFVSIRKRMSENHGLSEGSAKFAVPQLYHKFTDLAYVLGPIQQGRYIPCDQKLLVHAIHSAFRAAIHTRPNKLAVCDPHHRKTI